MNSFSANSVSHKKKFGHSAVHYLPDMTAVVSLINSRPDIQLAHNTILARDEQNATYIVTITQTDDTMGL
jgi:hypothetical protein